MTPITINLPGLPSNFNSHHSGWLMASIERKKWRKLVAKAALFQRPERPYSKCEIVCTRFSSVKPDADNLAISFKSCLDGLKDAHVIEDDRDSCVVKREYRHEKVKPREGRVSIEVIGLEIMTVEDYQELKRKEHERILRKTDSNKRRQKTHSRLPRGPRGNC